MIILCVIDSLGSGGAQRQMVELAIGFKQEGHQISFLTYHDEPFYSHLLENENIQVVCINESNYLIRLVKMRRFIRQGGYHAVLSFLEAANFICEIAGLPFRKWKLIVGERSANPNLKRSLKLRMYRWFHFLADYIVANSNANMNILRSINPLLFMKKCKVIHNAVDFQKWKVKTDYVPRNHGKLKLVIAASHSYKKNLYGLVGAVNMLTDKEKSQLDIEWYGDRIEEPYFDGSFKEAQMQITRYNLKSIFKFFPATHDLAQIYQNSDAIGLFSKYEGLPNVICEGMACAKPIICTGISDLPILLSHQSNLLSAPSDIDSIKKSISYLLTLNDDDLKNIGNKNRSIAEKYFNRNNNILAYLALMNS